MPVLTGKGSLGERTLFWGIGKQRAVRRGKWKLLLNAPGQEAPSSLFDLDGDFGETHDLTGQHPDVARQLTAALRAWEKDVGA
jgi:arylsulfatase A